MQSRFFGYPKVVVILMLCMTLFIMTKAKADGITSQESSSVFLKPKLNEYPDNDGFKAYLLYREKENHHVNHFCMVKQITESDQYSVVWIYWTEKNRLVRWMSSYNKSPTEQARRLAMSKSLDLAKDVVSSEAEIAGSTYLVTREWANNILGQCNKKGLKRKIKPFTSLPFNELGER